MAQKTENHQRYIGKIRVGDKIGLESGALWEGIWGQDGNDIDAAHPEILRLLFFHLPEQL